MYFSEVSDLQIDSICQFIDSIILKKTGLGFVQNMYEADVPVQPALLYDLEKGVQFL